jgi:hypothetical protein
MYGAPRFSHHRRIFNLLKTFGVILVTRPGNTDGPEAKCLQEIYKRSKAWEQKLVRAFKRDEDPHRAQKQLGKCDIINRAIIVYLQNHLCWNFFLKSDRK